MDIVTPFPAFEKQAKECGRALVAGRIVLSNGDPFPLYLKVARDHSPSFFLDSIQAGPQARYSYLSLEAPSLIVSAKGQKLSVTSGRKTNTRKVKDPLNELEKFLAERKTEPVAGPPFLGGAVGFFGYDCSKSLEKIENLDKDDLDLPDFVFGFYDAILAYDHQTREAFLTQWVESGEKKVYDQAVSRLGETARRLERLPASVSARFPKSPSVRLESSLNERGFERMVKRAKEYIAAGDIYQANLSQRFECKTKEDALSLYERLRRVNPSPYSCVMVFEDFSLVSSSPELLLRVRGKEAETRPIAGTRPRGETQARDQDLGAELLLDPKEQAEHIMLVDLERNDLGRVCEYGSVKVSEFMTLERYSHVIHIVSHVQGRLKKNATAFSAWRALFPGGTITGCPKVRCMEIIEELEPVHRGPYTGSAGWIGTDGSLDMNILIRTIVLKKGKAYAQVGAGIVADSSPEREYSETLHKAQAMLEALGVSHKEGIPS